MKPAWESVEKGNESDCSARDILVGFYRDFARRRKVTFPIDLNALANTQKEICETNLETESLLETGT